jgi:hypothetical protein
VSQIVADKEFLLRAIERKAVLIREANEKPAEPVRKVATDEKKVRSPELGEHPLGPGAALGVQTIDGFQNVFVVDRIEERRGRSPSEKVENGPIAR